MTHIRVFVLLVTVVSGALCTPTFAQTCSVPSFSQTPVYPVAGSDIRSVAAADFDGDGSPDLAIVNADTSNVTVVLKAGRSEPPIDDALGMGTIEGLPRFPAPSPSITTKLPLLIAATSVLPSLFRSPCAMP